MEQRFLADDGILTGVGQRQGGDIALDDLDLTVHPDTPRQFGCACNTRRRQFDAGDECAVAVRQITGRTAEAGAQVDDLGAGTNMRTPGQRVIGGSAAVMILIVREQIVRTQSLERAASCLELGEDDLRGDRMVLVKISSRANLRSHDRLHDTLARITLSLRL